MQLARKGKLDQAVGAFQDAIACKTADSCDHVNQALGEAGRLLLLRGNWQKMIGAYRAAAGASRDLARYHVQLSDSLHEAGDYEKSMAASRKSIALKAENFEGRYNLAQSLSSIGRFTEALAGFRCAKCQLGPNDSRRATVEKAIRETEEISAGRGQAESKNAAGKRRRATGHGSRVLGHAPVHDRRPILQ
jgi:tetratricopeptide (TPR) repeat protein